MQLLWSIALLCAVADATGTAQTPGLSGTWVEAPGGDAAFRIAIRQTPQLVMLTMRQDQALVTRQWTIDGPPRTGRDLNGGVNTSRLTLKNGTLHFEGTVTENGVTEQFSEVWQLSDDGSLVVVRTKQAQPPRKRIFSRRR